MRKFITTVMAAAIASAGMVGLSSSPASAVTWTNCRTPYTQGGWRAQPCIDWDGNWVSARGRLTIYPSNCSRWKLIARDLGGNAVQSTTSRPCSTADLSTPWFYGDHIQTFLVAYDADGRIVLSLETPQSHT